jgi:oxygen-independent coproporphyrinogen III oxidase
MNLGLYIHIPFCRKKCDYCSFYSVPLQNYKSCDINYSDKDIDSYISILLKELRGRKDELKNYDIDTIYFGGGTPSLLSPSQLGTVINEIRKFYKFNSSRVEFTVECNPDDFSIQKINEYKGLGVNRFVLGVQTTNARLHSAIGRSARLCNPKMLSEFAGINEIEHCIDIILGIPGQTENDLESELKQIISYGFEHISAYTLSIEKGTPLAARHANSLDHNDLQRTMLELAIDILTQAGYDHYEVSNYCLPSHQSKHNMKYWEFLPYAGFGPGAHSFYSGERYYNTNSVNDYIRTDGDIRQQDIRTKNSEIVEYILSGMRLSAGISKKDFEDKLKITFPERFVAVCNEMKKSGLLRITENGDDMEICFTRNGFFQMDGLIYEMTEMFL